MERLLIINPGSTSTKIAVYHDEKAIFVNTIVHQNSELEYQEYISEQQDFRKKVILDTLSEEGIDLKEITAIVGRGGAVKPLEGGTYTINEEMIKDCKIGYSAQHASNLGALIANEIAKEIGVASFIVDPPVVDEMSEVAKVTGLPGMRRESKFHALNQKAVARRGAEELGKKYEDANIIAAALGGGISVGIHVDGKVIDVNNCYDGEGPFSPERAGSVPLGNMIKRCFSGEYTHSEIKKQIAGQGGVIAHLGTNDIREVIKKIETGDNYAKLVYEAMAYQVGKSIAALAAVVNGKVDAIVLSGGIAHDKNFIKMITDRVEFISKVIVYPGEDEMGSLASGALRVLKGEEVAKEYDEKTIK